MKNTEELLTESGSIFKGWELDNITEKGMNIIRNTRQGKLMSVKLHQGKAEGIERNVLQVIAAAPEMLEALEAALTEWHSHDENFEKEEPKYVPMLRAAINKATGRFGKLN